MCVCVLLFNLVVGMCHYSNMQMTELFAGGQKPNVHCIACRLCELSCWSLNPCLHSHSWSIGPSFVVVIFAVLLFCCCVAAAVVVVVVGVVVVLLLSLSLLLPCMHCLLQVTLRQGWLHDMEQVLEDMGRKVEMSSVDASLKRYEAISAGIMAGVSPVLFIYLFTVCTS